jgi:hypothetical protein
MIIVVGSLIVLAIFLIVGWAVSIEMFQQRWWRRKVAEGDVDIVGALIEEALGQWKRSRIPKEMPGNRWAAIQAAELVAVKPNGATFSASVIPEYRSEGGRRVKVSSDVDEAVALAARLLDLVMYDVPNLRLGEARVDVFATLAEFGEQQPIVSVTADRATADSLAWDELSSREILDRFATIVAQERDGAIIPVELPLIEGVKPRPAEEAAAEALQQPRRQS